LQALLHILYHTEIRTALHLVRQSLYTVWGAKAAAPQAASS